MRALLLCSVCRLSQAPQYPNDAFAPVLPACADVEHNARASLHTLCAPMSHRQHLQESPTWGKSSPVCCWITFQSCSGNREINGTLHVRINLSTPRHTTRIRQKGLAGPGRSGEQADSILPKHSGFAWDRQTILPRPPVHFEHDGYLISGKRFNTV